MRVAVVHDTLNPCGGAERLALYSIRALRETGYAVDLITVEKTLWNKVEKIFGKDFRNYISNEIVLPPLRKLPTIYGRYLEWFLRDVVGFTLKIRKRYDLVMITKQLAVPVLGDIIYIHFPDFYPGTEVLYYPERYVNNLLLKVYVMPYRAVSKLLVGLFRKSEYKPLILTNSKFVKGLIDKWLGTNAIVVYPPVEVEKYVSMAKNTEREDLVVTIGRFERSKKLHVIPTLAKSTPGIKYVIIGTIGQPDYFQQIVRLVKTLGVEDRVRLFTNLDEAIKVKLLSKAKAYLHTMKYEHFGISVVEAMAAGTIPIVHKYSGSWIDIVSNLGESCCAYVNYEDCPSLIEKAISMWSPDLAVDLSTAALRFTYSNFKSRLRSILEVLESMSSSEIFK